MNERLNVALIGCGNIAARHARLLKAMNRVNLAAAADPQEERVKAFVQSYGLSGYTSYQEMLAKEPAIDVVAVLTPSGTHAAIGMEVARHHKHLIVEKPLALRLDEADRLIRTCEEQDVRLFVVMQNRYNRPVRKLREAVVAGRFGDLILGSTRVLWCRRQDYYEQHPWRGSWRDDGGVFANQAIHHLDLLQWLMGPVASVMAKTRTRLSRIEAEDLGVAVLTFKSGALGVVEATTCARPVDLGASLTILGRYGAVEIGGFAVDQMRCWRFQDAGADDTDPPVEDRDNPSEVYGFAHREILHDIVDCLFHGKAGAVTGEEGRKSLELVTALYESAETGHEVFLDGLVPQHCKLGRGHVHGEDLSERQDRQGGADR